MNKQLIIGIVAATVVIGGGAAYFLASNSGDTASNGNNSNQSTETQSQQTNSFDAASTANTEFTATITTTNGDKTFTGLMKHDKDSGNTSYEMDVDGRSSLTVYTADAYYFCQTIDDCIKYPLNQIGAGSFDPDTYQYTDDEIAGYKDSATYEGIKDCPTGSCDVWKISQNSLDTSIYIDKESKRITKVDGNTPTGAVTIIYDYGDVSVTAPTNVKTIPSLQ